MQNTPILCYIYFSLFFKMNELLLFLRVSKIQVGYAAPLDGFQLVINGFLRGLS